MGLSRKQRNCEGKPRPAARILFAFEHMGIATGIRFDRLLEAAEAHGRGRP